MDTKQLINLNLIKLGVEATTKEKALLAIANLLYESGRISDATAYYEGMLEREAASTTGFGDGIAIPHAKINEVITPTISVIKLNEPIEWQSMDQKPVQLLIALAVPNQEQGSTHLRLLAKLSENLMEEEFVDALLTADTEEGIYNVIESIF